MSLRRALAICAVIWLFAAAPLASAHSKVIATKQKIVMQRTSTRPMASITIRQGLAVNHRYSVEVLSPRKLPFTSYGFENYTYIDSGYLRSGTKGLTWHGTTPRHLSLTQPRTGRVTSWVLALVVQLKSGKGLTVRVVDLGK